MEEWVIQVDEKLKNMKRLPTMKEMPKGRCIYRIPDNVRKKQDEDDFIYRPYRVSFGPYYHDYECCQPSQKDKEVALLHFLGRTGRSLRSYQEAVAQVVDELIEAYDELDPVWLNDKEDFVKLMILDGCFLLEILEGAWNPVIHYAPDNPVLRIYENPSELECYRHDMLLLENQLPMRLLVRLLQVQENDGFILLDLTIFPGGFRDWTSEEFFSFHILDKYRDSFGERRFGWVRKPNKPKRYPRSGVGSFNIPSATELENARIGYTTSRRTISFQRKTLKLPRIVVDGTTKSRFLNIIAFETLHKDAGNEVTSYICFMRSLIQSANDVRLLKSRGIIISALHTDDEVFQLFYKLSMDIMVDLHNSLTDEDRKVGRKLRERYNKMSNEWRKDLFQNYLRSPWTIISVIAATILLTLTMIQTVYAVLSYQK